jgi:hypothetical protein
MTAVPYKGTGPAMTDLIGRPDRPDVRPDHQHHLGDRGKKVKAYRRHLAQRLTTPR